jgi:hypothetical protein
MRRSAFRSLIAGLGACVLFGALAAPAPARAEIIANPVAVFSGLDKITARIITFEAEIGETVQFGSLLLTPRACHTRPPTEQPNTTSFIEVEEVALDSNVQRIFAGWIFAASPGLNAIEHPVYDLWLIDCRQAFLAEAEAELQADPDAPPAGAPRDLGVPEGEIPLPPPRPFFF